MDFSMNSNFKSYTLNIRGQLMEVKQPLIMGILNITPDSFYSGSRYNKEDIVAQVGKMLQEGADVIDIGGQSTRPGSEIVHIADEWERIAPVLDLITNTYPHAIISVDTYYGKVAEQAVAAGASMINDISAGSMDPEMFDTVGALNVPYLLMHMQGVPQTMHLNPTYKDVVSELIYFFSEKIHQLRSIGVNDILIDPGFGFGKSQEHNLQLMQQMEAFSLFGLPIAVGISRKKMIQRMVNTDAEGALNAGTALHTIALIKGAGLLRVHDVKEAVETRKVVQAIYALYPDSSIMEAGTPIK